MILQNMYGRYLELSDYLDVGKKYRTFRSYQLAFRNTNTIKLMKRFNLMYLILK